MVVRSNVIITALFGILLNQTIIADPNTVFLRAVLPDRPVYRNEAFPVVAIVTKSAAAIRAGEEYPPPNIPRVP